MTTISSSTSALSSLISLYSSAPASPTSASGGLSPSSAEVGNVVSMIDGTTASEGTSSGLSALLGEPSSTGSVTDISSVLDAIEAKADDMTADGSATETTSATTTATTQQQKTIALIQSAYQSQQANLLTLLA